MRGYRELNRSYQTISGKISALTLCQTGSLPSRLQSLLRARDSSTAKVRYPTQPIHTNSFFRGLNLKPAKRSSCGRKVASINNLAPYDHRQLDLAAVDLVRSMLREEIFDASTRIA